MLVIECLPALRKGPPFPSQRKSTEFTTHVSLYREGLRIIKTTSRIDLNAKSESQPLLGLRMVILYLKMYCVSRLNEGCGIVCGTDRQPLYVLYI